MNVFGFEITFFHLVIAVNLASVVATILTILSIRKSMKTETVMADQKKPLSTEPKKDFFAEYPKAHDIKVVSRNLPVTKDGLLEKLSENIGEK